MMTAAYMRRQEWIAERIAVNTVHLLGQALGGKGGKTAGGKGKHTGPRQEVSATKMLGMAGEEIK